MWCKGIYELRSWAKVAHSLDAIVSVTANRNRISKLDKMCIAWLLQSSGAKVLKEVLYIIISAELMIASASSAILLPVCESDKITLLRPHRRRPAALAYIGFAPLLQMTWDRHNRGQFCVSLIGSPSPKQLLLLHSFPSRKYAISQLRLSRAETSAKNNLLHLTAWTFIFIAIKGKFSEKGPLFHWYYFKVRVFGGRSIALRASRIQQAGFSNQNSPRINGQVADSLDWWLSHLCTKQSRCFSPAGLTERG